MCDRIAMGADLNLTITNSGHSAAQDDASFVPETGAEAPGTVTPAWRRLLPSTLIIAIATGLSLALALSTGFDHDHLLYLKQWILVLEGDDPWSTDNAYGPLHNLLAWPLVWFGIYGAKAVIGGGFGLAVGLALVAVGRRTHGSRRWIAFALLVLSLHPIGLYVGPIWALNDGLVALFIVVAVLARLDGRLTLCGVAIGLAALLKFFPLALLPFLAFRGREIVLRPVLVGLAVFIGGMLVSDMVWGESTFNPLMFGSRRIAALMSPIFSLAQLKPFVGARDVARFLSDWNTPVVIAGTGAMLALAWRQGLDWLVAATLGFATMLTVYKVGHQQFWLSFLALVALLPAMRTPDANRTALRLLPIVVFLAAFQLAYAFLGDPDAVPNYGLRGDYLWMRQWAGAVAFPILVATITWAFLGARGTTRSWPIIRWR